MDANIIHKLFRDFPPTILVLYKSYLLMNVVTPDHLRSGNEDQLHTYLTVQNEFRLIQYVNIRT